MITNPLKTYLKENSIDKIDPGFIAYLASLEKTSQVSPEITRSIIQELEDQRNHLKLIASENYSSVSTQLAMGNLLTDKYAEGFANHRFYAGCDNVDDIESFAVKKACEIFGAEHAYVQPHSGADANMVAYWAIIHERVKNPLLEKLGETNPSKLSQKDWESIRTVLNSQKLLGLDYYSGGHLTHGYRHNISAQLFDAYSYSVSKETGLLDYDEIEKQAMDIKPLILLAGYSAYPRLINFKKMREIADKCGAVFMVDMAHFAGLVAGKVFEGDYNPVAHAHVVTTTTHKTLRGPRGGMVLCKKEFAEAVDKGCPLVLGGPLPHMLTAKAVSFVEAAGKDFKEYAARIVDNSRTLAEACIAEGLKIATGGTDNHLMLIDVRPFNITGRQAESALRECGITLNRNSLPFDPNGPWYTSGLRIGTPAVTSLGMGKGEMKEIASILSLVLKSISPEKDADGKPGKAKYIVPQNVIDEGRKRVKKLLTENMLYPELDLEFLKKAFM
ncbi:MAG: glycine hydroxymethyltransferase [Spirochaetes bacterium]|nr:glycine hydroxymethyltransferase [Spirochaetota bacterium]